MNDVTDVLRDRMQQPDGLQRMVTVSLAVHVALTAVFLLAPARFWSHEVDAPHTVMTITLGGSAGPISGGMTSIGGRPVQAETPPDAPKAREAVRAPAAKTPDMVLPNPKARPSKSTAPTTIVKQAPDDARGRTPTKGAQTRAGSSLAETGARGQGFGLSTGGGIGSGSSLDVGDFCCPDYLMVMIERIRSSWSQQAEVAGTVIVRFTINRDGSIAPGAAVERSSGYLALDMNAQRAVLMTRQLPPLPATFPNPSLTVHLNFQYQR